MKFLMTETQLLQFKGKAKTLFWDPKLEAYLVEIEGRPLDLKEWWKVAEEVLRRNEDV